MQAHKFVFILLIMGGLLTSYIIKPRKHELALMHLKSGKLEMAASFYEDMYQNKNLDRSILVPMKQVYLAQGRVEKAILVYEKYVRKNPDDISVLSQLASLYKDTYRYYKYMLVQEHIYEYRPSLTTLDELSDLYVLFGMKQKAKASLKQLIDINDKDSAKYLRLIDIQTSQGDYMGAEHSLASYVDSGNRMTPILAELRLKLLLSLGRTADAFEWASIWLDENREDRLRFTALLYSGGTTSLAGTAIGADSTIEPNQVPVWMMQTLVQVAWAEGKRGFLDVFTSRLSEDKKQKIPLIMARLALNKKEPEALHYWLEMAVQAPELHAENQLELAGMLLQTGNLDKAMQIISEVSSEADAPASLYVNIASEILKSGDIEKGLTLYEKLRQKHTDIDIAYPWALLAAAQGKQEVVQWLKNEKTLKLGKPQMMNIYYVAADRVHYDIALSVARQFYHRFGGDEGIDLLARSLLIVGKTNEAVELLRDYREQSPQFSELYEQALLDAWQQDGALSDEIISLWKNRLQAPDLSKKERRQLAFQLLQAGEKSTAIDEFKRLAKNEGPKGVNVRQLLFLWGNSHGKDAVAWLDLRARRAPRSELAGWWRHLVQADGSAKVMSMAKEMGEDLFHKKQNLASAQVYEQMLMAAWKTNPAMQDEVISLWKNRLGTPGLTEEDRRQLAFHLLKAGEKSAAIREFRQLAENERPAGKNVRQLLYIWGPYPEKSALDWLEKQANKSSASDVAGWWRHLVEAGGSKRVVAMAKKADVNLPPVANEVLTTALIATGDRTALASNLRERADKSMDLHNLEKLAKTAQAEGMQQTEEYIWDLIIKMSPENQKANRGLGLAAFSRGNHRAAEQYLTHYLAHGGDDWESNFYLAEVLSSDDRNKSARPYYERSLEQIEKKSKPSQRLRRAKALMYYRTGRKNDSMVEYDKLVKDYPADMELRAEYSTLLIGEGELEKARHLLGEK